MKRPNREEIAWQEIGTTAISRSMAIILSAFFLAAIFAVPLGQYGYSKRHGTAVTFSPKDLRTEGKDQSAFALINARNKGVLEAINKLETTLEEESLLRKVFLPPLQYVLLRFLGKGNDKAIPGRDGWLHFAPALDYLSGPPFLHPKQLLVRATSHKLWEAPVQPDPPTAIIAFKDELAARGIKLLVVPVPVKAAVQPDKISGRPVPSPLANRSYQPFVQALEKSGVQVFDPRPVLAGYALQHGNAYLATDTHWLPGAMQAVAAELAGVIGKNFPELSDSGAFVAESQQVRGQGDIARMLTLPENVSLYPEEEVQIRQILTSQQEFWQPDRDGQILLLGDSFTNIYSTAGLGWGASAGLAEQLSHFLQSPIDLLARNDSGAYVTREMLAGELARGRDRLAGKKLVIWQFAERELAFGDWRQIPLHLGAPKESRFFVAAAGEKIKVTGTVGAIARSPRPGSGPYRDNILSLHLIDMRGEDRELPAGQALVYGWGMRDNQLTAFAALRPGDTVSLTLVNWETVEGDYGSYRRTPLDDQTLELEIPNWGYY
ncbi:MAG: hypothetical protein OEL83_05620 [Desulforhopalus sp.]|nr:hypothetical protein [Desulforhopalus sp.]